jgi:hypothetical protein
MGLAQSLFVTMAHRVADAIPVTDPRPGRWNARRAFLGVMGLVQSQRRERISRMLQRQHDLGLFPDFDHPASASGFSQSRHLLRVQDCAQAWMRARDLAHTAVPSSSAPRWIAMDGSWLVTPRSRSCRQRWTTPTGGKLPQAVVVTAWDVRNRMPVGFAVLPGGNGERTAVDELLPNLRQGDIALVDRGFPSEALFGAFAQRGVEVIARMVTGATAWTETAAFLAGDDLDAVLPVQITDPGGARRTVLMRFIRRVFPRGRPKGGQGREVMVLATTLLDAATYPADVIISRYQERWAVETAYREMKVTFAIEHFHSPDANRIVQELYALMTWLCISALMEAHVNTLLVAKRGPIDPTDPRRWLINRTSLYAYVDQAFWALCTPGGWAAHAPRFASHCDHLVRYAQRKRPMRSSPRQRLAPFGHFAGAS